MIAALAAGVTIAWHAVTFTVPYDTTGAGGPGPIAEMISTCAAADSIERPLPLYADTIGHVYRPRPSGQRDTAWVRLPADGVGRELWVRAMDFHDWRGTTEIRGNVGPRSNASAILAYVATFVPADTLVVSTRGPVRDGRSIVYTAPTRSNPAVHAATFSYRDSIPEIVPPFVGGPAAVKLEDAMLLAMRDVVCGIHWAADPDTLRRWPNRGARLLCP